MSIIGDAFIAIRPDTDGFSKELEGQVGKGVNKAAAGVTKVAAAVGTAAVGAAVVSVKAFADFDAAMTNSVAIMGDVSDSMRNDMSDAAREVAKTTAFSADEAAESFYFLASAGMDAEASMAALPQVAAFAQAGNFDMARATDIATDAQSALGLASDDAAENLDNLTTVTDVFVTAATLANTSVEQIGEAMTEKAGSAMKALNMDVEEGSAVLAAFADVGIKGSQAGTTFSATMEGLTRGARENADEFDRLGVSVFDSEGNMNNMADIVGELEDSLGSMSVEQQRAELAALGFNRQSANGIQALMGNSDALREYEGELRAASGTTQDVADKQLETFWAQLGLLKDNLMDVALTIGEQLVPHLMDLVERIQDNMPAIEAFVKNGIEVIGNVIRDVVVPAFQTLVEWVGRLIEWWNNLSPATQNIITTIGKVVGVAVLLLPIILKIIAVVKVAIVIFKAVAAVIALVASPIGLVIAAVVGLAYVIYRYWDEIVEFTKKAWDWVVGAVVGAWEWIKDATSSAVEWVSNLWSSMVDGVKGAWTSVVDWLKELPGRILDAISGLATTVYDFVMEWHPLAILWRAMTGGGEDSEGGIMAWISALPEKIVDWLAGLPTLVLDFIQRWHPLAIMWRVFERLFPDVAEQLLGLAGDVVEWITEMATTVLSVVSGWVENIVGFVTDLWSRWVALVHAIRDAVVDTVLGLVASVVSTVVGWVLSVVERVTSLRDNVVELIGALRDRVVEAFTALRDRALEIAAALLAQLAARFIAIRDRVTDAVQSARDRVVEAFTALRERAVEQALQLVEWVRELPRRLLEALGNVGSFLADAGRKLIGGLTGGITEGFRNARDAMSDGLSGLRNYLPFSPAKVGPLSGSGSPELAGGMIAKMIGDGIAKDADAAVAAVETLTRDVAAAADRGQLSGPRVPISVSAPQNGSQGAPASGAAARDAATGQQPLVGTMNVYTTDPKRAGTEVVRSLRERAYLSAPLDGRR